VPPSYLIEGKNGLLMEESKKKSFLNSFPFVFYCMLKVKNQREIFFWNHPILCVSDLSEFYKLLNDGHDEEKKNDDDE
jgi:hypothetical protein